MDLIFNYILIIFFFILMIGLIMKVANGIGERLGIYEMIQRLWRLVRK
ncbi:hypothetical protein LGQ02_12060 [Bacillus shivajii]|nr:hypothetical protein [Bacillus shivajii]UCZ51602.1 hypothetical protein LGQ02_12060 [Bacillus shivajii]